jgi:hypothetical protein
MRIIGRIVAICAAAVLVAGITFGLAQSSSAQSLAPAWPAQSAAAQSQSSGGTIDASSDRASGRPAHGPGHEGNRSPSLFGALEIVKDLAIIGIIVALVALVTRVSRSRGPSGATAKS